MSQMSTYPVLACKVCGKAVVVKHLSTKGVDNDGSKLFELMQGLPDIALCAEHRRQYNWFARQNRADEFIKAALNPQGVLYNIIDETGLDYYGRDAS